LIKRVFNSILSFVMNHKENNLFRWADICDLHASWCVNWLIVNPEMTFAKNEMINWRFVRRSSWDFASLLGLRDCVEVSDTKRYDISNTRDMI
jgi:hypothetical protein